MLPRSLCGEVVSIANGMDGSIASVLNDAAFMTHMWSLLGSFLLLPSLFRAVPSNQNSLAKKAWEFKSSTAYNWFALEGGDTMKGSLEASVDVQQAK